MENDSALSTRLGPAPQAKKLLEARETSEQKEEQKEAAPLLNDHMAT